jgi:hypothetical protein
MQEEASPSPEPTNQTEPPEDPSLFCPRCSRRLTEHQCKLLCETCGYFMSCADYY